MDCSNEYIKMCEGAFEDLGIPQIYYGTIMFPILWATKDLMGQYVLLRQGLEPMSGKRWPLYCQDHLQGIMNFKNAFFWIRAFDNWFEKHPYYISQTMEQLSLMFVMEKKYEKLWIGTEWIKKGGG